MPRDQKPRLPEELEPVEIDVLDDRVELAGVELSGEFVGGRADKVEVVESRFNRVRATGSELRGLRLRDVVLEGCDLSGAILEGAKFERVAFVDCRLSGAVLSAASLRHVTFSECRMDQVSLRMTTATGLRLHGCDLRACDLYSATMQDTEFLGCDLSGADVTSARLGGSQFHRSLLDGLSGVLALRDVVIDAEQAVVIANALLVEHGITVTDEPRGNR